MMRSLIRRFTSSKLLAPKTQMSSKVAAPRVGRYFSTYKYNTLIEWLDGDGKSVLATPGFRDPRSQVGRNYNYVPLKYEGVERKQMLESATIEWIGGALHGLNKTNGKNDAYAIVGGSGTGKTRFLGEIAEQWDRLRALSTDAARANTTGMPSREIPTDTLVFPICFNHDTSLSAYESRLITFLQTDANVVLQDAVDVLATTRCLHACYDVPDFSNLCDEIFCCIRDRTLDPYALNLSDFLKCIKIKNFSGKEVPVVILIDEVSKLGDRYMNDFIPAMNNNLSKKFVCIWTTLAEGPLARPETRHSQRAINKIFLPALTPTDSRSILTDSRRNISKLKMISKSLFLCWNEPSERVLVDHNDVLTMLAEAAGGLPRGIEKIYQEIEKLDPVSLTDGSMPLMDLLASVSSSITRSYSNSYEVWQNCLYLALYKISIARKAALNLSSRTEIAAEAISGGCLIDFRLGSRISGEDVKIRPVVPVIFHQLFEHLENSLEKGFTPKSMEILITDWLDLWFSARQACLYGTATTKPIMDISNKARMDEKNELWRPFGPLLSLTNKDNKNVFSALDKRCVLEQITADDFPSYDSSYPGIYLPSDKNYEGLDAVVVIPSGSGKREDSVLIAIEAKNSLRKEANNLNIFNKLPAQYSCTITRMKEAGWTPGSNAFYYVMSKGSLGGGGDEDDKENNWNKLLEACPNMRVLAGKELEAAMGPSIYWVFKHMRVVGAVYQKKRPDLARKQRKIAS